MRAAAWTRTGWLAAAAWLLLGLYVIFLNPHLDIKSYNSHDPVTYLTGAQSLWRGDGYGLRFADVYMPMKLQPPGVSALMAPVVGIFGVNFVAIKLAYVGLSVLLAWCAYRLFRAQLGSGELAALGAVWLMACPVIFRLGHQVMAEVPLLISVTAALLALDRYLRAPGRLVSGQLWLAAAATAAAAYFKGLGLAVLAGAWLLPLLTPRWRSRETLAKLALYSALVAVPVAWWLYRCHLTPSEGFHGRSIADFYLLKDPYQPGSPGMTAADWVARIRYVVRWGMAGNFALLFVAPAYFMHHHFIAVVLGLAIGAGLAWQWWRACRRDPGPLEGFSLVGWLGVLLYVHGNAVRFLSMLFPAMLIYALRGAEPWLRSRRGWAIASGLLAMSFGVTIAVAIDQWKDPHGHPLVRDYTAAAQAARAQFGPDSRCLAPEPAHWQLLTGHACLKRGLPSGGAAANYALVLAEPETYDPDQLVYFKRDLITGARKIATRLADAGVRTEPVARHGAFMLVRVEAP